LIIPWVAAIIQSRERHDERNEAIGAFFFFLRWGRPGFTRARRTLLSRPMRGGQLNCPGVRIAGAIGRNSNRVRHRTGEQVQLYSTADLQSGTVSGGLRILLAVEGSRRRYSQIPDSTTKPHCLESAPAIAAENKSRDVLHRGGGTGPTARELDHVVKGRRRKIKARSRSTSALPGAAFPRSGRVAWPTQASIESNHNLTHEVASFT